MKKEWKILLFGLVGLVLYVGGLFLVIRNVKTLSPKYPKQPDLKNGNIIEDDIDNLIYAILIGKYSDAFVSMVIGQAKHETGNYTSDIFHENKNLFGMKKPSKRHSLVLGENRGHGTFNTYEDSVDDYIMFLEHFNFNEEEDATTVENYVEWLKGNGYFTDTLENYLNGVKSWL